MLRILFKGEYNSRAESIRGKYGMYFTNHNNSQKFSMQETEQKVRFQKEELPADVTTTYMKPSVVEMTC